MKTTKISIGFKSKNQLPWFMVVKEYYINGEIDFAKVLFQIWPTKKKYIEMLNSYKQIKQRKQI